MGISHEGVVKAWDNLHPKVTISKYSQRNTLDGLTGGPWGTSAQVDAWRIAIEPRAALPRVIACLLANLTIENMAKRRVANVIQNNGCSEKVKRKFVDSLRNPQEILFATVAQSRKLATWGAVIGGNVSGLGRILSWIRTPPKGCFGDLLSQE